nr:MAG TPA: hypothetical protein [Caudoviricetes sp.]
MCNVGSTHVIVVVILSWLLYYTIIRDIFQ